MNNDQKLVVETECPKCHIGLALPGSVTRSWEATPRGDRLHFYCTACRQELTDKYSTAAMQGGTRSMRYPNNIEDSEDPIPSAPIHGFNNSTNAPSPAASEPEHPPFRLTYTEADPEQDEPESYWTVSSPSGDPYGTFTAVWTGYLAKIIVGHSTPAIGIYPDAITTAEHIYDLSRYLA